MKRPSLFYHGKMSLGRLAYQKNPMEKYNFLGHTYKKKNNKKKNGVLGGICTISLPSYFTL